MKVIIIERSDDLWRFACDDVFEFVAMLLDVLVWDSLLYSRLHVNSVCVAKFKPQDCSKHPEGRGAFLHGWFYQILSWFLDSYPKVVYMIALALVTMTCSSKGLVEASLGIPLHLTTLLLFMIGILSTSLVLVYWTDILCFLGVWQFKLWKFFSLSLGW